MSDEFAPIQWSFSSLKSFKNCPKRYFHEKVAKDVKSTSGAAADFGKLVHEALENYALHGTPLPVEHSHLQDHVDVYIDMPGERRPEIDLSLKADYTPCTADDPEVWYKGFADLVILQRSEGLAYAIDYKTGNPKYADPDQLEIYALAIFKHFPEITEVRGVLDFLAQDVLIKRKFLASEADVRWLPWIAKLDVIRKARQFDNWPANRSGLCKFCPVHHCQNHPSWKTLNSRF